MITLPQAELRVKIIKAMAHPVRLMAIEFLREENAPFQIYSIYFSLINPQFPSICSFSRKRESFHREKPEQR